MIFPDFVIGGPVISERGSKSLVIQCCRFARYSFAYIFERGIMIDSNEMAFAQLMLRISTRRCGCALGSSEHVHCSLQSIDNVSC